MMERAVTERDVTTRHPVAEGHALVLEYKVGTTWVRLPSTDPLIRHLLHSFVDLRLIEMDKVVVKIDENFDAEYKRMDMDGRGISWFSMKAAARKGPLTQTLVSDPHTSIDTTGRPWTLLVPGIGNKKEREERGCPWLPLKLSKKVLGTPVSWCALGG